MPDLLKPFRMKAKYTPGHTHATFKSIYATDIDRIEQKVKSSPPKPTVGSLPTVEELSVNDRYRYVAWLSMPTMRPRENAAEVSLRNKDQNENLLAAYQLSSFMMLLWLAIVAMVVSIASFALSVVAFVRA